jgi:hypothetical protein
MKNVNQPKRHKGNNFFLFNNNNNDDDDDDDDDIYSKKLIKLKKIATMVSQNLILHKNAYIGPDQLLVEIQGQEL